MPTSVVRRDLVPFIGIFTALIGAALIGDYLLHQQQIVWLGRYLGIPGTLLILGSLVYSLRKRKLITTGNPGTFLRWHEFMAWLGSMLILVHAGIHFNALLPWLAVGGMLVNVASGLTGKYLLQRARRRLLASKTRLQQSGKSEAEIEQAVFWDAIAIDVMMKWRTVHFPVAFLFGALAAGHILSIFIFWGWR
ncbi:MAG: hypothetical protein E6R07_13400 [Nevskiaceae bacterium]|nr:MAG: hypothetical protein E6R07_13400 [Nevskiaceae bacterium]